MKELNRFRQFINEDQMKNLAKLLRDEADQPDNKVGKSIFLKYAKKAEDTDVKDIKPLLKKLEDELIDKHPDTFSGEDDIVGSFLSTSKNYKKRTKENVNELFGARKNPTEKQAMMVFDTIEFMDDLVSAGHMDKAFFDVFTEKIGEAYSSLMMGASPELQSKMGFEVDVDLEENDAALDEVINEAKPNLKKALPTIAARNVERNNAINFDIEEMMDMVGEAGKGEKSEEAKILFKASNASSDLEQALVDLQIYFEEE